MPSDIIEQSALDGWLEVKNPSRYMTWTYTLSLSFIAILSIVVHLMLDRVIAEQALNGELINVSGQQRMLSQRSTLFAMEYLNTCNEKAKEGALSSLQRMRKNHDFLLTEHFKRINQGKSSPLSQAMYAFYFTPPQNVDKKVTQFIKQVTESINDVSQKDCSSKKVYALPFVELAKEPLLRAFNIVVEQYEVEGQERVDQLRQAQNIVLGIIILTLFVEALFIFRPMVNRVSMYAERLQHEANYDMLSELLNRRAFAGMAHRFIANCQRYNQPLTLIAVDIDFFKRVNDTYGHDVGDAAINWVASVLRTQIRSSDCAARLGGEEFIVLLPNTGVEGALKAAEKLRRYCESHPFKTGTTEIPITLSCGVSEVKSTDQKIDEAIKRADQALYRAKETGRNRVCVQRD